jgi:hypothetical protein
LAELFSTISKEEIQLVLEKYEGDVDAAGEELLQRVAAPAVETAEQRKQRERDDMISTLALRFVWRFKFLFLRYVPLLACPFGDIFVSFQN